MEHRRQTPKAVLVCCMLIASATAGCQRPAKPNGVDTWTDDAVSGAAAATRPVPTSELEEFKTAFNRDVSRYCDFSLQRDVIELDADQRSLKESLHRCSDLIAAIQLLREHALRIGPSAQTFLQKHQDPVIAKLVGGPPEQLPQVFRLTNVGDLEPVSPQGSLPGRFASATVEVRFVWRRQGEP